MAWREALLGLILLVSKNQRQAFMPVAVNKRGRGLRLALKGGVSNRN